MMMLTDPSLYEVWGWRVPMNSPEPSCDQSNMEYQGPIIALDSDQPSNVIILRDGYPKTIYLSRRNKPIHCVLDEERGYTTYYQMQRTVANAI